MNDNLDPMEVSGIATGAAIRIIQEKFPEEFKKAYDEGKEAYLQIRENFKNG